MTLEATKDYKLYVIRAVSLVEENKESNSIKFLPVVGGPADRLEFSGPLILLPLSTSLLGLASQTGARRSFFLEE